MNESTTDHNGEYNPEYLIVISNFIVSIFTLLVNGYQSYKSRHCESDCCGNHMAFGASNSEL